MHGLGYEEDQLKSRTMDGAKARKIQSVWCEEDGGSVVEWAGGCWRLARDRSETCLLGAQLACVCFQGSVLVRDLCGQSRPVSCREGRPEKVAW